MLKTAVITTQPQGHSVSDNFWISGCTTSYQMSKSKQTYLLGWNLPNRKEPATREKLHIPMDKFVNKYKIVL